MKQQSDIRAHRPIGRIMWRSSDADWVTANVGGDPERVRYPVVRLVATLSDELARRLGYAE
jgi:hypothetical protein